MSAPILVMVYTRQLHLQKCIASLQRSSLAKDSVLYVSSDAPGRPQDVPAVNLIREWVMGITGFKKVIPIFHRENLGLHKAYRKSIDLVFEANDSLIFLEDDVIVSPDFVEYMNRGLEFYHTDDRVYSVSGFSFSIFSDIDKSLHGQVYFANRFLPWGFATWKHKMIFDGKYSLADLKNSLNDHEFVKRLRLNGADLHPAFLSLMSQGKMLTLDYLNLFHMVKNELVTVMPYVSRTFNIGNDGSGSRTKKSKRFESVDLSALERVVPVKFENDIDNHLDYRFYRDFFSSPKNRYKQLLAKVGLLGFAMKIVSFIKRKSR